MWVLMPFGFELHMLLLHLRTLETVVDGFLIVESTTDIAWGARKRAHLTEALASGTFGFHRAQVHVRVLDEIDEKSASHKACGPLPKKHGYSSAFRECLERWQRYATLRFLLEVASADDVALLVDADEIARPEVVAFLRRCYPFARDGPTLEPGMVGLSAREFTYGVHCSARHH